MGATKASILTHFIGESVVIATFGVVLGLFFAIQFPMLNIFDMKMEVYFNAILLATLSIYALVIACAFFPSRQAAQVYPAAALHEK
jgi:putative ABC transport system permease protein